MTQKPRPPVIGSWPADCLQRAFVDGFVYATVQMTKGTPFPSERDDAEAEAIARYGDPSETAPAVSKEPTDGALD